MKALAVAGKQPTTAGQRRGFMVAVLLLLVVVSSLAVIYSSFKSRQQFSRLQALRHESLALEEEWGRLLLEHSTWSTHERIERIATKQLDMAVPETNEIVVVSE